MTRNIGSKDNILEIDAINIRLPAEFRQRADQISRQVAKHLSRLNIKVNDNITLNQLNIGPLTYQNGETDGVLAKRIAEQISNQIQNSAPVDISNTRQYQHSESVLPSINHSIGIEPSNSPSNKGAQEGT